VCLATVYVHNRFKKEPNNKVTYGSVKNADTMEPSLPGGSASANEADGDPLDDILGFFGCISSNDDNKMTNDSVSKTNTMEPALPGGPASANAADGDPMDDLLGFLNFIPSIEDKEEEQQEPESDTDSQAHLSDDEDIFCMRCLEPSEFSQDYRRSFLELTRTGVLEVCEMLRAEPLLPLDPLDSSKSIEDVDTPYLWPSWHCPFAQCTKCGVTRFTGNTSGSGATLNNILPASNSVREFWRHVWGEGTELGAHRMQLARVVDRLFPNLISFEETRKEMALTFLEEAVAEKCRCTVERVGIARDRRALNLMDEVLQSENCKTLMCFICNSKHVYYRNFDKFGKEYNAGRIDYRNNDLDRVLLRNIFSNAGTEDSFFSRNLCSKRFRSNYGSAVEQDPHLSQADCYEWRRFVHNSNALPVEILCNPEDVIVSENCQHRSTDTICSNCAIPICNECWKYATKSEDIPKAMCNDNFVGYIRRFFLENNVTWLESTIACPLFSGLITYYIEGKQSDRHHLMMQNVAQPRLAYGVRGNIFSFLTDWEQTQKDLSRLLGEGDVWDWPMNRERASQIVRVRIVKCQESIIDKFKELKVRAEIVRQVAYLYIEHHMEGLLEYPGAQKIHAKMQQASVRKSLEHHVDERMQQYYPASTYAMPDGAIMPELRELVREQNDISRKKFKVESAFENKQSTMPDDAPEDVRNIFQGIRPHLVVDQATVDDAISRDTQTEFALNQIAGATVKMSNTFVDQYVSRYLTSIFPWILNYSCGGPEYPELFNLQAWEDMEQGSADPVELGVAMRWRRVQNAPVVTPGMHAQHLATRSEAQVGADWMCVPAARSLHWRYCVLHKAFVICKEKIAAGESLHVNLQQLIDASTSILERLNKGTVKVHGVPKPVNGDLALLFRADDLLPAEKVILRCYLNVTQSIAGCQAIRRRIGHCLFGFRVVVGECIFVTISPNRRWSRLIMRLSRIRRNDPMADATVRAERSHVEKRAAHAGATSPELGVDIDNDVDLHYLFAEYDDLTPEEKLQARKKVDRVFLDLQMPSLEEKQAWNSEDPLSSVHHYLVNMKVYLPLLFGIRMCLHCPLCNEEEYTGEAQAILRAHYAVSNCSKGCQNSMGNNARTMGGYAGLAQGLAFATELQGDSTPHGHGFMALANAYQHSTLEEIAEKIQENSEFFHRVVKFNTHLHTEEHIDHLAHQRNISSLQQSFHSNYSNPRDILMLGLRLNDMGRSCSAPFLWSAQQCDNMDKPTESQLIDAMDDANNFKEKYDREVQRVFSRVQHHWHDTDKEGKDIPMKYCRIKTKHVGGCNCKMGFPRQVAIANGVIQKDKYRHRVVCPGIAKSLGLRCSGRRNALGSIVGRRLCKWFSGTSAVMAKVFKSNTNVQVPYRVPITGDTHDKDCTSEKCLSPKTRRRQFLIGQRAVKQMLGYFGGYISKKQKIGRFELKQSVAAQPYFHQKLSQKTNLSAGNQLAHVTNRMFTNLEGKGILRSGVEESLLASEYNPGDQLSAEFIRTFRNEFFFGKFYIDRYSVIRSGGLQIPSSGVFCAHVDLMSIFFWRAITKPVLK